jgi:hypothetical protein
MASLSVTPPWCLLSGCRPLVAFRAPTESIAVAVGHDEQSLSSVLGANVGRAPYSDRNAATQPLQCRDEGCELPVGVPRDVLSEETTSPAFIEDADDLVDEKPVVICSAALSGDTVWLARVARQDAIHCSTPASSGECCNVRPDRR